MLNKSLPKTGFMATRAFNLPAGQSKLAFGARGNFVKLISSVGNTLPIAIKFNDQVKVFTYFGEAIRFDYQFEQIEITSPVVGDTITLDIGFGFVVPPVAQITIPPNPPGFVPTVLRAGAVVNGGTLSAVVVAPVAGKTIRLLGYEFSADNLNYSTTGPAVVNARLVDSGTGVIIVSQTFDVPVAAPLPTMGQLFKQPMYTIPLNGIRLSPGASLELTFYSTTPLTNVLGGIYTNVFYDQE